MGEILAIPAEGLEKEGGAFRLHSGRNLGHFGEVLHIPGEINIPGEILKEGGGIKYILAEILDIVGEMLNIPGGLLEKLFFYFKISNPFRLQCWTCRVIGWTC